MKKKAIALLLAAALTAGSVGAVPAMAAEETGGESVSIHVEETEQTELTEVIEK